MDPNTLDNSLLEQEVPNPVNVGVRFANLLIDTVIYYIIVVVLVVVIFLNDSRDPEDAMGLFYFIYFISYLAYYSVCETYLNGATIGKLITGTKVIMEDGSPITFNTALLRTLSRLVPFEAFSFLGNETGWHDRWTKTLVVKKKDLMAG